MTKVNLPTKHCETCPAFTQLEQMGIKVGDFDRVIALAGNPNTGKSTLFNALTGLKQHTGNWPGKTVTRAEGGFEFNKMRYKLVDLPGTYSLLSASQDEEVARDFILFGQTILHHRGDRCNRGKKFESCHAGYGDHGACCSGDQLNG